MQISNESNLNTTFTLIKSQLPQKMANLLRLLILSSSDIFATFNKKYSI